MPAPAKGAAYEVANCQPWSCPSPLGASREASTCEAFPDSRDRKRHVIGYGTRVDVMHLVEEQCLLLFTERAAPDPVVKLDHCVKLRIHALATANVQSVKLVAC